jgi:ABC-2 type transport system permease protein
MSTLSRYSALITRELVEHRRGALYAAPIMASIMFVLTVASSIWNGAFKLNSHSLTASALAQVVANKGPEGLVLAHQAWMFSLYMLFHGVAGIVMFAYALSCLFEERKDRSTLFWRSLPVRDWETVTAKAFTLLVIIPLVFMVSLMLLQLLIALFLVLMCWVNKLDASQLVLSVIPFGKVQLWQLVSQLTTNLWVLPIFAWCLFCSAVAKQRPFLLATLIPGMLTAILGVLNLSNVLGTLKGNGPAGFIGKHYFQRALEAFTPGAGVNVKPDALMRSGLEFTPLIERWTSTPMLIGLVIGVALLCATAYVRRYREDAAA